jgi:hypothetical protein
MDNALEIGGALRVGPGFAWLSPDGESLFYAGVAGVVTVGARYWVSKSAGIVAGFEAWLGLLEEPRGASPHFNGTTMNAVSLCPTVGFAYRFW